MKVCVYRGSLDLVEKSGVGQAVHHQLLELSKENVQLTDEVSRGEGIIQINTVFPDSVLAAIRAKHKGWKVLWYGHSTEEDFRNSFRFSNLTSPLFRRWIVYCYQRADAIITPTEYARDILWGYGITTPIYVLSNGVDTDAFRPDPRRRAAFRAKYHLGKDQKAVLCVGHYMERKGILEFMELAGKMPDVLFFWFGHTSRILMTNEVQRAIQHAPENVLFPGYADRNALLDAYNGCDLFCFMSHEETEGIVVLEALACGIPVLVRDIPVYRGWLHDGINVYKADTTERFRSKAEGILNGTLPDLTKAGRECAMERSLPKIGEKLAAIQKEIAHETGF